MHKILVALDGIMNFKVVYAHCDIPCGIYDPHAAQVAAHTVYRMDMLIAELAKSGKMEVEDRSKFVRYNLVKEQHAEICKHEISVLWGDYFKLEHAKANPGLHELVWNTLKAASKAKQSVNVADADALLENVEKVAEIFWKTKSIPTVRVKAPYPTEKELVLPRQ